MAWLIAWVLMMFFAVSSVETSGSEVAIPVEPDHGTGSGAAPIFVNPDCEPDIDMPGGTSPGEPGIVTGDVQPVAPVRSFTAEPELASPCDANLPPDGVVVSPDPGGVILPGGADFPGIEPGVPEIDDDRALKPAFIEGLDLVIRESWPPQYVAQVTSALPGGCSQFEGYTVERDGGTITVAVWNSEPAAPVPCTMQYGYFPFSVELGSDFESGVEYTLVVGERELSFVAQ